MFEFKSARGPPWSRGGRSLLVVHQNLMHNVDARCCLGGRDRLRGGEGD